jgi:stage V sporulation protein AE
METLLPYIKAFVVGGLLCVIGQILLAKTNLTFARILVIYVVMGVVLSAFTLYGHLIDYAGAGASIPLTGFGHSLAQGVKTAVDEKGWVGILTGGVTATAGGIAAAIFFGYINALIFNPKTKK